MLRPAFIAFGLLSGGIALHAQLPQPLLNWVFPPGGAAGTTNTITVGGSDLDEASALVFTDPRVVGRPKVGVPGAFEVVIPSERPTGLLDVRVAGRFGISNPRIFVVEPFAALSQPATNTTAAASSPLPAGSALWGRISPASACWYRIEARRGERILIRVLASELDSRLVPTLAAFDLDGRELARVRRGGLLDFTVRRDGPVRVQLTDSQFRGGDEYVFRVENVSGPHVDFSVPCVVTGGITNRVTLLGRRLPGGRPSGLTGVDGQMLEQVTVDVPVPASVDAPWPVGRMRRPATGATTAWAWRWPSTQGPANAVVFAVASLPVQAQPIPDTTSAMEAAAAPVEIRPPVEFGGWLGRTKAASGVEFEAKKGDVYWMEVMADRLGQVTDATALVQRLKGADKDGRMQVEDVLELGELDSNPAGSEFNLSSRDCAGRFEAPQDGRYRVVVRDLFSAVESPVRRPYRLTVRRVAPDFRVWAWAQSPPKSNNDDRRVQVVTPQLRRGGTLPVRVAVARVDGFDGGIEVRAEALPKGIHAMPARIPSGISSGVLLLTADEDVAPGQFRLDLVARSGEGAAAWVRPVRPGGPQWALADFNQEAVTSRLFQELRVGVVPEVEPVTMAMGTNGVVEAKAGTKLTVPLRVQRRFEFPAAFNVKPAGHAVLEKAKELSVPEKATNVVLEIPLNEVALPVGEHTIWVQGQVAGKYRNQPELLAAAESALKAAESALSAAKPAEKAAAEEKKKAAEAARKAAEERAKPKDVTLGVWSAPLRVRVLPAP